MAIKQLVEKRNELAHKQRKLQAIFAEGRGPDGKAKEIDLDAITSLKGDHGDKLNEIRKMNEELEALGAEVESLAKIEQAVVDVDGNDVSGDRPKFAPNGTDGAAGDDVAPKGIGDLFVETRLYKNRAQQPHGREELPNAIPQAKSGQSAGDLLKATFLTTSGWAPESIRTGRVVDAATRPIQVIDAIPAGTTTQEAVVYMEETTFTPAAAERAEEASYAAATFVLTQRTNNVRMIGARVPVTDEQLEDVPQAATYLNQRLGFGVRQRLDGQILTGAGTGVLLTGFNNVASILTQAKGSDPEPDAIYKGMRQVRVTGRAVPSVVFAHPNDWETIRLLRTADGIYIWGNPSEAGPMRIWGVMVVETDAQTENTVLIVDAVNFTQLVMRRNLVVEVGLDQDDFSTGRQTVRAGLRAAVVVYRAAAICTVSGM